VESINLYNELKVSVGEEAAFKKVLCGSRDHSRTPMQWDASENAGFTTGTPWIGICGDYKNINVEAELKDEDSILNFYRKLIRLRKENEAFVYGDIKILDKKKKNVFTYIRSSKDSTFLIECNLCQYPVKRSTNKYKSKQLILSNYNDISDILRPYEANLYRIV